MNPVDDKIWENWLTYVMSHRPKVNRYLNSQRGKEIAKVCLDWERNAHDWHRSDKDTFWIDVALFTKYKLSDEEIVFICNSQAGINNYTEFSNQRNAYAEMMRGLEKLRAFTAGYSSVGEFKQAMQEKN